jgi:dipeptide/tripeptide permease
MLSLVFAREREVQSRFAVGFAIAALGWLIGMAIAVSGHQPLSP